MQGLINYFLEETPDLAIIFHRDLTNNLFQEQLSLDNNKKRYTLTLSHSTHTERDWHLNNFLNWSDMNL